MRDYVARPRPELTAQARAGRAHLAGMVPQLHELGTEAEVDFCEALVIVAGKPMKTYLFTLRLSYSGKSVHRVFASQGQEAFMEGHVEAFHIPGLHASHFRSIASSSSIPWWWASSNAWHTTSASSPRNRSSISCAEYPLFLA